MDFVLWNESINQSIKKRKWFYKVIKGILQAKAIETNKNTSS